jgi:hypothetical protein
MPAPRRNGIFGMTTNWPRSSHSPDAIREGSPVDSIPGVAHVRYGSKADSLQSTVLCLLYPRKLTSQRLCGREDL